MAMNVTPFVGTDNFNMETFNNMISQINSGVNSEISDVLAQLGTKAEIVIRAAEGNFGTGADQKLILVYGSTWCKSTDTSSNSHNFVTWSGNSVSWYCTNSAYNQMNQSGTVYRYVAFLAADE